MRSFIIFLIIFIFIIFTGCVTSDKALNEKVEKQQQTINELQTKSKKLEMRVETLQSKLDKLDEEFKRIKEEFKKIQPNYVEGNTEEGTN